MSGSPRRAVFLDRDGTITKEGEWIKHPGALELIDGAAEAVHALHEAGYLVVMYSNQSAVARGMITEQELAVIHERLQQLLERRGDRLDAIYSCPHHPTEGVGQYRVVCDCRKPKPGLLLRAQREMNIDLARSWCVGDMARDLEAGQAAGVRGILVATGKGREEFERLKAEGRAPRWFERDLTGAVSRILAVEKGVALS
jgi:D-glycero-D-manno-heptose 1,7-bisphosphate phosphatase